MTHFDEAWKFISEHFFHAMMTFFLPEVAKDIDWSKSHTFLEKELLSLQKNNEVKNKIADKLVRLFKLTGEETWVLIHIEFQAKKESDFATRMFEYYYRIYDKYKMPTMSVAILMDQNKHWRPVTFYRALWNCRLQLDYPVIKLIDFNNATLDNSRNPIAKVVQAHLCALIHRKDPTLLLENKIRLVKALYTLGYTTEDIRAIYTFINHIITLPPELENKFIDNIRTYESEVNMYPLRSAERMGLEKGIQQGKQEGIQQGKQEGIQQGKQEGIQQGIQQGIRSVVCLCLEKKFGPLTSDILEIIHSADCQTLEQIALALITANHIHDVLPKTALMQE